jgi:diamine N-acetyltransferase
MFDEQIRLRALERENLRFIHKLDNNRSVMSYWFEEPYESFDELVDLYDKHIHDANERRFIAWRELEQRTPEPVGLVELIEINTVHRNCEFQIIVAPAFQGKGYAKEITRLALDWAFMVLNLHKVYLYVSMKNEVAIHIYKQAGFIEEGKLIDEFWANGEYEDVLRMYQTQPKYLERVKSKKKKRD